MRQLKIVRNIYSCLVISLVIFGLVLLFWPKISLGLICKMVGIVFLVYGVIKILGYFTKDMFQLAFQFDLGLGIVSIFFGLVILFGTENLVDVGYTLVGIFILIDAVLKMQTAIEAKRFGLQKWWVILGLSLVVAIVGIVLIAMPWKMTKVVTRLIGINLCLHGLLNLWVIQNTVKIIRRDDV